MDQTVHVNNEDWQTVERFENEIDGNCPTQEYNDFITGNSGLAVPTDDAGGIFYDREMFNHFMQFKAKNE